MAKINQEAGKRILENNPTAPKYRVLDENGENMAGAVLWKISENTWLYVDDVDGWEVLDPPRYRWLILEKIN